MLIIHQGAKSPAECVFTFNTLFSQVENVKTKVTIERDGRAGRRGRRAVRGVVTQCVVFSPSSLMAKAEGCENKVASDFIIFYYPLPALRPLKVVFFFFSVSQHSWKMKRQNLRVRK